MKLQSTHMTQKFLNKHRPHALAHAGAVVNYVIDELCIDRELFMSRKRDRYLVDIRRAISYYLMTIPLSVGPSAVGNLINKDHATVIYLTRTGAELIESHDFCFINLYERVKLIADTIAANKVVIADEISRLEREMARLKSIMTEPDTKQL